MSPVAPKRVFFIDDDQDLLDSLETIIKDRLPGVATSTFTSARTALEKVPIEKPDLVVTDFFMPDMDGLEFARLLGKTRPDLPVMILSGFVDEQMTSKMKQFPNVKNAFHKPLPLAQFIAAIRTTLQGSAPLRA